jgi:integrase
VALFEAKLPPREDRDLEAPLFIGVTADRLRTAIARACKAAGVPVFSPHDLRHRRSAFSMLRAARGLRSAVSWVSGSSASPATRTRTCSATVRSSITRRFCCECAEATRLGARTRLRGGNHAPRGRRA